MAKRKTAGLPRLEESQPDQQVTTTLDAPETASPTNAEVVWVNVRVPVYTGDLGGAYMPDKLFSRLQGEQKATAKRVLWALERAGETLNNGKQCAGNVQELGVYVLEAIRDSVAMQQCSSVAK